MSNISKHILNLKIDPINTVILIFLLFSILVCISFNNGQHYFYAAKSILNGSLSIDTMPVETLVIGTYSQPVDTVKVGSKLFYPLGMFPIVILLPAVTFWNIFFKDSMNIGVVHSIFTVATFYITYKLARAEKFSAEDSKYLAFALLFSTVAVPITYISTSYLFAQIIALTLQLLFIWELTTKRRPYILGTISALLLHTRILTSFMFVIPLFLELKKAFYKEISYKSLLIRLIQLGTPIVISLLILFELNRYRYGSIFATGYSMAHNTMIYLIALSNNHEVFSFDYLIPNFKYYFLSLPQLVYRPFGNRLIPFLTADWPGVSFFITSPIFFRLFYKFPRKTSIAIPLLSVSSIILFIQLTYVWSGWYQVGPRYMIDILPMIFYVLLKSFPEKKLSGTFKTVIIVSALVNTYLFLGQDILWE